MTTMTTILLVTTTGALTALGIAGCSDLPTTQTQVCQQFDELGQESDNANGFFDSPVFQTAGELASTASHYPGSPSLTDDAASLRQIATSGSTTSLDLSAATTHIAQLCGHPLGIGTADDGTSVPAPDNQAGGGDQFDSPTTSEDPPIEDTPTLPDFPTTTQNATTDEASAQAALQQQIAADQPTVDALAGQWVPQLSSKTYGMVTNGITYGYLQIWQDFESINQAHPGALLLWSGDYTSFQLTNYYVTILPDPYPSGSQAAGWCTSNGLGANDCYAKLISHTAGPKGSTVQP